MSTYYGYTRTNYFQTTDEAKLREILASCVCDEDEEIEVWCRTDSDGVIRYAFGCYASINGIDLGNEEKPDYSYDAFTEALQNVIPDGEVILLMEVGHEKLCDLVGIITVITNKKVETKDLYQTGIETGRKLLGDNNWSPWCW